MISRRSNPKRVDEMTPGQQHNCAQFGIVKADLRFLDEYEKIPSEAAECARRTRRLVSRLLELIEDPQAIEELEFTPLEVKRLQLRNELTEDMRIKFRIFADHYLDKNMPSQLASRSC